MGCGGLTAGAVQMFPRFVAVSYWRQNERLCRRANYYSALQPGRSNVAVVVRDLRRTRFLYAALSLGLGRHWRGCSARNHRVRRLTDGRLYRWWAAHCPSVSGAGADRVARVDLSADDVRSTLQQLYAEQPSWQRASNRAPRALVDETLFARRWVGRNLDLHSVNLSIHSSKCSVLCVLRSLYILDIVVDRGTVTQKD